MFVRFSHLVIVASVATLAGLVACSTPDVTTADDNLEGRHTDTKPVNESNNDNNSDSSSDDKKPLDPNASDAPDCKDECIGGTKRCSAASNSGTELCVKASDGCNRWTQGTDCSSDSSCDRTKNDGSCKIGCVSDNGCSAGSVGSRQCSPNGTAEITCSQSGSCFVFKTTRTNILQECTGTGSFCSFGARKTCVESTVGACRQHAIASNPCSTGTTCSGGSCVSTCSNDIGCYSAVVNTEKCNPEGSRSKSRCAKSTDGCYHWTTATSCSPDEKCSSGSCVFACSNNLGCSSSTLNTQKCSPEGSRSVLRCSKDVNGCYKWVGGQSCPPDAKCQSGDCVSL